jgi:hypothetical protein
MAGPSPARHAGYQMRVADEIASFIAEVEAALGGADDRFGEMLRRLYRSDDPRIIGICDDVCAVIGRKDFSLAPACWRAIAALSRCPLV